MVVVQEKLYPMSKTVELHSMVAIIAFAHEEGGANTPVGKLDAE